MGDPVPIVLSPKRKPQRRGRLPLPASSGSSPWGADLFHAHKYDLRRLPKAEREAARRARTETPAQQKSAPQTGHISVRPLAATLPSPHRVQPGNTSSPAPSFALFVASVFLLTSLGLVFSLSLLLARVPLSTPLQIPIQSGVPEAQVQAFLATLLHLPHVSSVRFLTKEAQMVRAQERSSALPRTSSNPFSDTVEIHVASLRSEALLMRFFSQPSLQALLDERLFASAVTWENAVGERMEELRFLLALIFLFFVCSLVNFFLALAALRTPRGTRYSSHNP